MQELHDQCPTKKLMVIISKLPPCILLLASLPTSEVIEEPRLHFYRPWSPKVSVILFLKHMNMYHLLSSQMIFNIFIIHLLCIFHHHCIHLIETTNKFINPMCGVRRPTFTQETRVSRLTGCIGQVIWQRAIKTSCRLFGIVLASDL